MRFVIISYSSTKFVFILFVIFSTVIYLPAQTNKAKKIVKSANLVTKEKVHLNVTKPAVYVDFERLGEEAPIYSDDSKERVYLKLVNNSKWSIYVGVFSYGKDNKKGLFYDVEKERKFVGQLDTDEEIPMGYRRGHVGSPDSELKSGKSISFSVPRNHLAENLKIRIEFDFEWNYDWMNRFSYGEPYPMPQMSVLYLSSSLDKFLEEKKIVK